MNLLPDPKLTSEYIIAVVTTVVGLFLTQGLISNGVGKLVTGLAAVLVPLAIVIVQALVKSRAHAAKLHALSSGTVKVVTPTGE